MRVTPPVRRALETTVKKLRESGHDVVEWNNKLFAKAYNLLRRLFTSDGGKKIKNQIEKWEEPTPKFMEYFFKTKEIGS